MEGDSPLGGSRQDYPANDRKGVANLVVTGGVVCHVRTTDDYEIHSMFGRLPALTRCASAGPGLPGVAILH